MKIPGPMKNAAACLALAGGLTPAAGATVLFHDQFNTSAGSDDVNFEINASGRQTGPLAGTLYRQGNANYGVTIIGTIADDAPNGYLTQVNNEGSTDALWLVGNAAASKIATVSLEHNFTENPGLGGYLSISFSLNPDTGDKTSAEWGGITVGAGDNAAYGASGTGARGQFINHGAAHFGILVRDNGAFQAFNGSGNVGAGDLTETFLGMTSFELRISGPVDGNPWDGANGTTIDVYVDGGPDPFFSYTAAGSGYTDNYVTLIGYSDSFSVHEFDDLMVRSVPEPALSLLVALGGVAIASRRRGRAG